jgi:hypothetical protein
MSRSLTKIGRKRPFIGHLQQSQLYHRDLPWDNTVIMFTACFTEEISQNKSKQGEFASHSFTGSHDVPRVQHTKQPLCLRRLSIELVWRTNHAAVAATTKESDAIDTAATGLFFANFANTNHWIDLIDLTRTVGMHFSSGSFCSCARKKASNYSAMNWVARTGLRQE